MPIPSPTDHGMIDPDLPATEPRLPVIALSGALSAETGVRAPGMQPVYTFIFLARSAIVCEEYQSIMPRL